MRPRRGVEPGGGTAALSPAAQPAAQWHELAPLRRAATAREALSHVDHRALVRRNWRRLLQRPQLHGDHACSRQLRRRLTMALANQALRASPVDSDALQHLHPRTIVLISAPGPNQDNVVALIAAATLHLQEQSVLAAVICNGGGVHPTTGLKEARNRAALTRCILDYFGLHDVPVGIGERTAHAHTPWPHEYDFPGFGAVEDGQLCDGQELLVQTLELVEPRSLTLVVTSALSDVARLIRSHGALLRDKAACVTVMGGVELEPERAPADGGGGDGGVRTFPPPVFLRPDHAANNAFDPPAAMAVYSWCVEQRIPLRVVSRAMVPNIPHRVLRAFASEHPYDPVMRYLTNASDLGLVSLWRRICRGEVQGRDKRWFLKTFCAVSHAHFEQMRGDELGENFPIGTSLDGTFKSYDVVTLLLALHEPSDRAQQLFAFDEAALLLNGTCHYLFVRERQLVPAQSVIEHLERVYQLAIGIGKWSARGRLQQTRSMLVAAIGALSHQAWQGHAGWVMCGVPAIVNRRECVCSGSRDGTVRMWDVWTGGCVKVLRPEQRALGTLAASGADSGGSAAAAAAAESVKRADAHGSRADHGTPAAASGASSASMASARAHSDRAHSDRAHSDRAHSDRAHSDRAHSDRAHSDRAHSDRAHSDRAHSDRAHSDRAHSDRAHSDRAHSDRAHSDRAHSDRTDGSSVGDGDARSGGSAHGWADEAPDDEHDDSGADLRVVRAHGEKLGVGARLRGALARMGNARAACRRAPRAQPPPPVWVTSIAKSPSHPHADTSTFFLGLDDGSLKVWSLAREGELSTLLLRDEMYAHPAQVSCLLIVDSGQSLLSAGGSELNDETGGPNDILQWDLKFSLVVAVYSAHARWVRSMAASSDGLWFFSASNDGTICKWRVFRTSDRVARTATRTAPTLVLRPAQLPSQRVFGEARKREWIRALAHSNGSLFSGGNDGLVRRWDADSGCEEAVYQGHKEKITALAVPQGVAPLFIFSGSNDCFIFQWSIARCTVLARIECRTPVTLIALALDAVSVNDVRSASGLTGREYRCRLFSGHYDSTMLMWHTTVVIDERRQSAARRATAAGGLSGPSALRADEAPKSLDDETVTHALSPPFPRRSRAASLAGRASMATGRLMVQLARSSHSSLGNSEMATTDDEGDDDSERSSAASATPTPLRPSSSTMLSAGSAYERAAPEVRALIDAGGTRLLAGSECADVAGKMARGPRCRARRARQNLGARQGSPPASETLIKTVPRSSAARFTHTPASSVLTAAIDGPMVTLLAVLYAMSHPMWRLANDDQLARGSAVLVRWAHSALGVKDIGTPSEEDAFAGFERMYALAVSLAILSIALFVGRLHERCVYALRTVDFEFQTDFTGLRGLGSTRVVYATYGGRCLYYVERFLVYFVIMLGGAGFFAISRYLLKVIECVDGVWRVNASYACFGAEHTKFLACSGLIFPAYILVACRMSASYNDVTHLCEVQDNFPSNAAMFRQLFTFWGSTVVKRAGLWTRHPVHGWKFGLTGRLCILVNWIADLLVEGFDAHVPNRLRWISVALWVLTAYILVAFTLRYQPMAEPFSSKVLVVFRAVLSSTYVALALTCALVLVTAADPSAPSWHTSRLRAWSLVSWATILLIAVPTAWLVASRRAWQNGDELIAERQAAVLQQGASDIGDDERRRWGLGSLSMRLPNSPCAKPGWNRVSTHVSQLLRMAQSPTSSRGSRDSSHDLPLPRMRAALGGMARSRSNSPRGQWPSEILPAQPTMASPMADRRAGSDEERAARTPTLSLLRRAVAASTSPLSTAPTAYVGHRKGAASAGLLTSDDEALLLRA